MLNHSQENLKIIGIGELHVSRNLSDVIVTYSLGSCVGLTVYDPVVKVGGMVHCKLPESSLDKKGATLKPGTFVDTGFKAILQAVYSYGGKKERLQIKLAGGSSLFDNKNLFRIGERNLIAAKEFLKKERLRIVSENIGGSIPRTLYLVIEDGKTMIRSRSHVKNL